MGYYIQVPKNLNKAQQLKDLYNATEIPCPKSLMEVPADKALVCVVSNGLFDAAAYAHSEGELQGLSRPSDMRPKYWLLMDKALVEQLSGFAR